MPEERLQEAARAEGDGATGDVIPSAAGDAPDNARSDARALLGYLERRVKELTDDLADGRNEALGMQAGRVDVLTALVETERARAAEVRAEMTVRLDLGRALLEGIQAERNRLLVDVRERRRSWLGRVVSQLRG